MPADLVRNVIEEGAHPSLSRPSKLVSETTDGFVLVYFDAPVPPGESIEFSHTPSEVQDLRGFVIRRELAPFFSVLGLKVGVIPQFSFRSFPFPSSAFLTDGDLNLPYHFDSCGPQKPITVTLKNISESLQDLHCYLILEKRK